MTANQTYSVILEPLEDNSFIVHIPAFPEIWVEGETEDEVLAAAKDAIEQAIADYVERGAAIPGEPRKPIIREVTVSSAG